MANDLARPDALVALDRYPLDDLAAAGTIIADARAQLSDRGAAELPGFVHPEGVARLADDAESLAGRSHPSEGVGTAYLDIPDFDLPEDHPRRWFGHYGVRAVAYDLIPYASPLRWLYEWDPLVAFLEAVLDRGPIYRYADPFGALNLAVMEAGDELQWHFDQADFVVSVAIQDAEEGGDFEVAPLIRGRGDERYDDVAAVLAGDRSRVVRLPMTPGTLLIFEGRYSLHRVSPIAGPARRHVGLMAYDTQPGVLGSDLLRMNRYGRTEAFPEPPA